MKNFTNNFKQFTSRLSARWLLIALMFLLGTSGALAYNQSAVDLYFDDSEAKWSDNSKSPYVYIGHSSWTACYGPFTRVSGTQYLFKLAKANFNNGGTWSGASGWVIANEKWWDTSGETIDKYVWHGDKNVTKKQTSAWVATKIYKANGTTSVTSDGTTKTVYNLTSSDLKNYTVTIESATGGTLTVKDYDNTTVSSGASKIYLTVLKFSASTSTGYTLKEVQINDGSTTTTIAAANLGSTTYTLKSAVTITPVWTANTYTITYKDQGNATFSGTHASGYPTKHTYGTTTTLKTASKTGYTFGGWFTKSDCSGTAVASLGATAYTANITLYAKWELSCSPANYTVSFAGNATSVNKGSTLQASVSPSGDGHGTVTWSSSATGVATVSSTGLITGVKGGQATITATVAKGTTYCGGSAPKTITVKETPSVTISGTQEFCSASTTLTATVTGVSNGVSYTINWYKDGGATSLGTGATYNATASGTYTAKVTGTYINTTTSAGYAVTKKTAPTKPTIKANKTISNGTISLMSGESVTFSVTQVAGETYTWYRGNNNIVHTGVTYTTSVNGSYTVKATNSCGDSELSSAVTVSVCEPIDGLYWKIDDEDKKDIYCPGDKVEVTLTYKGSEAKAHTWGGNWSGNIDILADDYATGTVYTMTINKSGSVNLTLTDCDDKTATTETLYFTVATAPAAPQLSPSGTINVGQNKSTTITVNNMDANATYVCYKGSTAVGTWNGNSVTFNVGDATGNFTYSIVATNKTCGDLTAETEFTVKVEEAGVKIAALGSKALYTNDPTHFIPLYVSNEDLAGVGATSVKKYTWQFSANGTSGWADCTRNYGNFNAKNNKSGSKVVVSNGGEKSNNYRANQVGYYRCKLTYNNDEEQVSGNIQVTGTTNNKTNKQHIGITYNLPIISVNTGAKSFPSDQGLASKSSNCGSSRYPSIHADDMKTKISVDVMMFNPDGSICYDRKARMNYRGSSSLNFKKKSYAFVTGKEKTKNLDGDVDTGKANLFGLSNGAEDKDWVLYAATPDPSMMRNRLVFDLYQNMRNLGVGQDETKEWGVNSMYVELVVNGEYRGVYVLMDKITCNADRVNIKNENGFIVKFDKTDVVDRVENTNGDQKTFATSRTGTENSSNGIESYGSCIDQRFEIEYPEKEDIELWDAFYGNVQQRFENFETALANKDYATVRTLIDYDSWADWFIITELAKNQDGFRASCIFVYDGDKIEARPLWDQELSFNNGTRVKHGIDSPEGLLITTSSVYSDAFYPPFWFTGHKGTNVTGGLLNDPCFVSLVKQKWATYQSGVCSAASIGNMVAAYNTELGDAITREAARWPYTEAARGTTTDGDYIGYYSQGEGNPDQYSYAASKNAITAWIADRSTALTANSGLGNAINNLEGEALIFTITPSSAETTPWQQVQLTVNAPAGYEYTLNVDELKADNAIIKENGDSYGIKIPRPAAWGVGGNGTEQSKQYNVTATIEVSGENACGTISNNTATSVVKLNDITEACNPEIIKK